MKKIFFIFIILSLIIINNTFAARMYGCTSLTGGGSGALDALDLSASSSPNSNNLADGDAAIVSTISGTTVNQYFFILDIDGTDAESSPNIIRPDDYASAGVWRLVHSSSKILINDSSVATTDSGSGQVSLNLDNEEQARITDGYIQIINGIVFRLLTTTDGHTFVFQVYDSNGATWRSALTFENGNSSDSDPINWPRVHLGSNVAFTGFGNMAVGKIWGSDITTNTVLTYTGMNQKYSVTAAVTVTLPDVGTASDDAQYGDEIWLVPRDSGEVVTVDLDAADKFNFHSFVQAAGATIQTSGAPSAPLYCIATTDSDGSGTDGYICREFARVEHVSVGFDPSYMYDQESTYRSVPLFYVGNDMKEGIGLFSWRMHYVGGNPTTELNADLICDTTPDHNTAAGATVMDVLDTTDGDSSASSGFDSSTCANGSYVYIHFGADPTDANVFVTFDLEFYK